MCMCSIASAADLRMPAKAPPVIAPAFSWTGCYIGGYVGGAWAADDVVATDRLGYDGVIGNSWGYKPNSSFIGGGTVGCNWQPVGSQFVLGLEGELGYLSLSSSGIDPLSAGFVTSTTKVGDWYGIIAGRLGYSFDRALIYVKGGAAFVNVENGIVEIPTPFTASVSQFQSTWAVGGGVEWAFNANWSVKAEYMYIALGGTQTLFVPPAIAGLDAYWDHENTGIHTAKVGINYRFGGGAPVVARY